MTLKPFLSAFDVAKLATEQKVQLDTYLITKLVKWVNLHGQFYHHLYLIMCVFCNVRMKPIKPVLIYIINPRNGLIYTFSADF